MYLEFLGIQTDFKLYFNMARPESGQGLLDGHEEAGGKEGMHDREDPMDTLGIPVISMCIRN